MHEFIKLLTGPLIPALVVAIALGGCGDESADTPDAAAENTVDPDVADAAPVSNSAPAISGTPPAEVKVSEAYYFQPTATDADGDTLTFSVSNRPPWASFDPESGALSGTPGLADLGTTANISIQVSDGQDASSLAPFLIAVVDAAAGSVTLNWMPPTENDDGSTLTDLAGYRILWGTSSANLDNTVTIDNPGIASYTLENLVPDTYYFALVATNSAGVDSAPSNVVAIDVTPA